MPLAGSVASASIGSVLPPSIRDLARQPARTALTIAGITIGIFALTVLGAMAEHFRSLVEDAEAYVGGTIRVVTKTNAKGENPGITEEDIARVRAIRGVRGTTPTLALMFDGFDLEEDPLLFLQPKPLVEGLDPGLARAMRPGVRLVAGRWLEPGDDGKRRIMVVRWLARRRGIEVGKKAVMRHNDYDVIGIYDAPDVPVIPAGIVPFTTLRGDFERPSIARAMQFFSAQRQLFGGSDDLAELARRFVEGQEERYYPHEVVPVDASPAAVEALAAEVRKAVPNAAVIEPKRIAEQMEKVVAIFLAITGVVSVISSIVGGLLIVNTMAMAVVERRREIAIKVAVGASAAQVAGELVVESAILSLAGTLLGVALGLLAIAILDPLIVSRLEAGESLFRASPRLIALVATYGLFLGAAAGFFPALRAARADPARGLREL